jgi:hypothetical protein
MNRRTRLKSDPAKAAERAERRAARREAEGPRPEDLRRQERQEAGERAHEPRATLARKPTVPARHSVSVASREQVAKRNAGASIVSGRTMGLDAAHICPRALGGCDHPDCTVPLTRAEHRAFDTPNPRTGKRLDILPYLVAAGCHAELAHALEHYRCDLPALLERVTGEPWCPVDAVQAAMQSRPEE